MTRFRIPKITAIALCAASGLAMAASHGGPKEAYEMRSANMKTMAKNLGIIGNMVKGDLDYDSAAATEAATALLAAADHDVDALWPEGSDSSAVEGSRAKAEIWADFEGFKGLNADLVTAAAAMKEAAGTDLAAMQAAMGALGGTCGACHRTYRAPKG
ncbi:cytochrome c [Alphaproteobacteria bacterium KMM 3653]|uniref:Cytochrome c n=1 Tax=Harenicola maris TaxID=2841044 RepID=A0AAP2G3L7_9RHOB|nr:cytochrome c [Harenicola maris]